MHTLMLQALKHPSEMDLLVRELVQNLGLVPEGAYQIDDCASLPIAVQHLARCADRADQSWACWLSDDGRVWFFIAEMPLAPSRERGKPVLHIDQYREDGVICDTGQWVEDAGGKWVRYTPE